jgi:integrase
VLSTGGIHHLRHAFVTALAERGVHERVAQHLVGHADSRMTRDIYTHVTRTMLDGATEAMEAAAQDVLDRARGSCQVPVPA